MKHSIKLVAVFVLALLASACSTQPDVIFVREDLDLAGEPRQILKVIDGATVDAAYYNGDEWIVVEDVAIPPGWLVVSPALAEPEPEAPVPNPEE